ncbi:Gfo/Idh/MocA family protein [Paludisphaera borealis]|uniref:4-carboxy-2-hydroxymuconate-6-semialdehyde dehydrogenase n=1 Tax=Paludisphaera borealis TaxID=1387353 RepID=A0A1U7CKE2_9BACT|nr:Gfo/Idh/MocA family oxidoreductase [Paludisphaera borealis]APW59402.1 4-carboxy-2-hydroxymuconate-6-semialdehyde dehydrogenase [Paludisphaera borealis]
MEESKNLPLRIGVIGLGRLWETRHKPSLARFHDRFRVTAVYDQVYRRAEIEAAQLGCTPSAGLAELIERPDVDAVYLLSPQWFGLHPVHLACAASKPIYCALPLSDDLAELELLVKRVEESGVVFMPEFARRCYPATLRLKELLATTLGPSRLVIGHSRLFGFDRYAVPGPTTQVVPVPLTIDPGSYLLDWCSFLFQAPPESISSARSVVLPPEQGANAEADFESFTAEFPGGAAAQISYNRYHRTAWGEASRFLPPAGFQVFAERGAAWLEMPDRIQWWDSTGTHEERLPLEPTVGDVLNDQFHRLVRLERSFAPTIRDALAVARLVHDLRRSQTEGIVVGRGSHEAGKSDPPPLK